jgi:hypothetical protein
MKSSSDAVVGGGSPGRTRTCDHSVNSRTLYQLSYRGPRAKRMVFRWLLDGRL